VTKTLYYFTNIYINKIKKAKKKEKKLSQPQNEGKCPKKFTQLSQSPQ